MGSDGLTQVSRDAVLSANYIRSRLKDLYPEAYPGTNMHEVVLSGRQLQRETGVRTMDVAKRLMDHGFHPPRADEQHAVGQPADDVLSQLLAGEQLLGQHGVFRLHEADAAVQLHRDPRARRANRVGHHYSCPRYSSHLPELKIEN